MRNGWTIAVVAAALAVAGCGQGAGAPNGDILANSLTPREEPSAPPAADAWIGRWNGPESLFLDIARDPAGPGRYVLTIKADLDSGGDRYAGAADGAAIRFSRGGKDETIRRGTGAETGFKWLADKRDCLVVVAGREGYCRD